MKRIGMVGLAILVLLAWQTHLGWAQGPGAKPPTEGFIEEQLSADEPQRADRSAVDAMIGGRYPNSEKPNAAALSEEPAKKAMTAVLKWYLHRLTQDRVQAQREGSVGVLMDELLGTPTMASRVFPPLPPRRLAPDAEEETKVRLAMQRDYVAVLTGQALPILKQLLRNKELIVRVNAARILDRFAAWGREGIAETLIGIIDNPKEHNAVRYYAIEALGRLLLEYAPNGTFGPSDAGGARYRQAALSIYRWLDAYTNLPKEKDAELTSEERDGISMVRRHAMTALGNTGKPRLVEAAGSGAPQGPIATLFLKIMDNDAVSPAASWPERVDAAFQLSRLQPKLSPSYQPDYVIGQLAGFIAKLGSEGASDTARKRLRWRYTAVHLNDGLENFKAQLIQGSQGQVYFDKVHRRMVSVLEYLDDSTRSTGAVQDLVTWLAANPPASKSAFKD